MFSKKKSYKPLRSMSDVSSGDELDSAQESSTSSTSNTKNLIFLVILSISIITNFVLALLHWPTQSLCRTENSHASRYGTVFTHRESSSVIDIEKRESHDKYPYLIHFQDHSALLKVVK